MATAWRCSMAAAPGSAPSAFVRSPSSAATAAVRSCSLRLMSCDSFSVSSASVGMVSIHDQMRSARPVWLMDVRAAATGCYGAPRLMRGGKNGADAPAGDAAHHPRPPNPTPPPIGAPGGTAGGVPGFACG